jgi:GntR family transcriptional regulator
MNEIFLKMLSDIEAGEFAAGIPLPPVEELARRYDASGDEVREAIKELIYEGRLERPRAQPLDAVQVPPYELWGTLTGIHSITREAKRRGQEPGTVIVGFDRTPAWPSIRERMGLDEGDEVVLLGRLRTADGDPVAIEISYYPAKLYAGISEEMFTAKGSAQSSFKVMQEEFGLTSHHATDEISVVQLEAEEAEMLNLAPGTPVLLRFRVTYTEDGRAIKASRAVWKFKAGYQMDLN